MRKCILVFSFLILLIPNTIRAQEMSSPNYKLQGGMTGMTTGSVENSGSDTRLSDIVGDQTAAIFASKGYIINPSFSASIESSIFSISLSPLILKFDEGTKVQDKSVNLSIYSSTLDGFSAFLIADTPLKSTGNSEIPRGLTAPWNDESSVGLVYRVDSVSASTEFDSSVWYRSLALLSKNEVPDLVLTNLKRDKTTRADVTFRLKNPANQPKGQYRNTLNFIVLPKI